MDKILLAKYLRERYISDYLVRGLIRVYDYRPIHHDEYLQVWYYISGKSYPNNVLILLGEYNAWVSKRRDDVINDIVGE